VNELSIFKRIGSIFKSQAHATLDKVQNSNKLMDQYIRDMQKSISQAEESLIMQLAYMKRLQSEQHELETTIERRQWQGEQAATLGNDDLAYKAFAERNVFRQNLEEKKIQKEAVDTTILTLMNNLSDLRGQLVKMKSRRNMAAVDQNYLTGVNKFDRSKSIVEDFQKVSSNLHMEVRIADARIDLHQSKLDLDDDSVWVQLNNTEIDNEIAALKNKAKSAQ
jgi:phage shock protein A